MIVAGDTEPIALPIVPLCQYPEGGTGCPMRQACLGWRVLWGEGDGRVVAASAQEQRPVSAQRP